MSEHQITGVRVAAEGTTQEHITHYRVVAGEGKVWKDTKTAVAIFPKSKVVGWAKDGDKFTVTNGGRTVTATVHTRPHTKTSSWLQTVADGYYDDNLMALTRV